MIIILYTPTLEYTDKTLIFKLVHLVDEANANINPHKPSTRRYGLFTPGAQDHGFDRSLSSASAATERQSVGRQPIKQFTAMDTNYEVYGTCGKDTPIGYP